MQDAKLGKATVDYRVFLMGLLFLHKVEQMQNKKHLNFNLG